MRENEKTAIAKVVEILNGLLSGQVPAMPAQAQVRAEHAAVRARAPIVAKEGDIHLVWDEENNGFGCNICGQGVFKTGEAALHAFTDHGILLADLNAEGLTHGRKWMMKKYLEKNAPEALEGYGRGAKAEAPAPAPRARAAPAAAPKQPIKKWKPFKKPEVPEEEQPAQAAEETDSQVKIKGHLISWHPGGNPSVVELGEIVEDCRGHSILARSSLDGQLKRVPTSKEFGALISPFKASEMEIPPHKPQPKPWQTKKK